MTSAASPPHDPETTPEERPDRWEIDSLLLDGTVAHLRPTRHEDEPMLRRWAGGLSALSLHRRYFGGARELSAEQVVALCRGLHRNGAAFVAVQRGEALGTAVYEVTSPARAELGCLIADAHQGRGVGSLLLELLAAHAREQGIATITAEVLADNAPMLAMLRDTGLDATVVDRSAGVLTILLDLATGTHFVHALEERRRRATVASISRIIRPRAVAVVGAGRHGGIGRAVFDNLLRRPFNGRVFPINPSADQVAAVPAYPSVSAVPSPVDLAVIAVPADQVPAAITDCGRAGVAGVAVLTSQMAEAGAEGARIQEEVLRRARAYGMRVVGPNCMGLINNADDIRLNATFAAAPPGEGNVGFFTQSGALGIAILEEAQRRGLQLSSFVSAGNKVDVSGNDLLEYWEQDPSTDVILLYLESFGNPVRFAEIARRVAQHKPILALKGGRTAAGARAASSHTAALAAPDILVDALFERAGVMRCATMAELFDAARLFATGRRMAGPRVAVVGNAGGAGILAADACASAGLSLAELETASAAALREAFPGSASNPLDMSAMAEPHDYSTALEAVVADDSVDAVVCIFVRPLTADTRAIGDVIAAAAASTEKPVVAVMLGADSTHVENVPVFAFPEAAVTALATTLRYHRWLEGAAAPDAPDQEVDAERIRAVVDGFLADHAEGGALPYEAVAELARATGISQPAFEIAGSESAAVAAAERLGFPVAVKSGAPGLSHRTERGGVATAITGADAVRRAYRKIQEGTQSPVVMVQAMATEGVEALVGVLNDPRLGAFVAVGSGGIAAELVRDQVFAVAPLGPSRAATFIDRTRLGALLAGYRGAASADRTALQELLVRVSLMAAAHPAIATVDMNPVIVHPDGLSCVDVKIVVRPPVVHRSIRALPASAAV